MIKVTEMAAEKIKENILKQKNPKKVMLRISFGGYGWGGPRLQLTLDELKNQDDVVIESQGITVIYNSDIEEYVQDSIIDYSKNWFQRGLVIRGAKTSTC